MFVDSLAEPGARRITHNEIVWLGLVVLLGTLNSIDAITEIPPLGDDYWMIQKSPGAIAFDYWREYGWGRPLGMAIIDLANTIRAATGASVLTIVFAMRVVTLVAVYFILRRLFSFQPATALFAVLLLAWNPAAGEGWVLLSTLHLAVSVVAALLACGLYARVLGLLPPHRDSGTRVGDRVSASTRVLVLAAAAQVTANLIYEQGLLAVPAFVATLVVLTRPAQASRSSKATALVVAIGTAGACAALMFVSGYVQSRSTVPTSSSVEVSDLGNAVKAMWIGFGQHHVWRIIEMVRFHRVTWWDASAMGAIATISTLGATALVVWRCTRNPESPHTSPNAGIAIAALVATYAAFLPTGFAYAGYTIVSRIFYLPGAFLALSVASLMLSGRRGLKGGTVIFAGAALLWLGILSRRYYEDMRGGSRILRIVARHIAEAPASLRSGGLLLIAPSNVGTFSTSAVEPWSIRAATRELTGVNPEGPIFLLTDCAELRKRPPKIDDAYRHVDRQTWSGVLRYRSGGIEIHSNTQSACVTPDTLGTRVVTRNER